MTDTTAPRTAAPLHPCECGCHSGDGHDPALCRCLSSREAGVLATGAVERGTPGRHPATRVATPLGTPQTAAGRRLLAQVLGKRIETESVAAIEAEAIEPLLAEVESLRAKVKEYNEGPSGPALIPNGEPCPICGPRGHGHHEDDSYGSCVMCREYVAHTDTEFVPVAWPCPASQVEPLLALVRAARRVQLNDADPDPLAELRDALAALPESVRVAARKPE